MNNTQTVIQDAFDQRDTLDLHNTPTAIKDAIHTTIQSLSNGNYRVASKDNGQWVTHEWLKKAILLSFKINPNTIMPGFNGFYDKVALKYKNYTEEELAASQVRIVPPASIREGAYVGPHTVLMPSFVNIGAYIDSHCMIDTWATVGSCAQIGKRVHLSGGAGIGGILEPLNAHPTIIEDDCFIGARSEIVEGVIVEEGAVISMGVFIGQSTPIYNRLTDEVTYGRIPKDAVVIPGTLPGNNNKYSRSAAIIMKFADKKTRSKLTLNELLRDIDA